MDLTLSADQQAFAVVAREFLDKEVVPYRAEWDRAEAVDTAIIPKLGEIGFFGLTIPVEYGGIGGDNITYCVAMEELGRADSAVRGIVSASMGLVGKVLLSHGSEEQKQQWLPHIRPAPARLFRPHRARRRRTPATWRRAPSATEATICCPARRYSLPTPPGPTCAWSSRAPAGQVRKGLPRSWCPPTPPASRRGRSRASSGSGDRPQPRSSSVAYASRLRRGSARRARGSRSPCTPRQGQVSVGAGCVGIIRGCLEAVVQYSTQRHQFGRPLASFQLIQDMIVDISVDADAARLLVWRAADLIDRGEPFGVQASKAKYFASEAAVRASNLAIQAFGGYGYIDEYPVQKYMRDARVMALYEGTSQIQKLLIGRAETGVSAFR